MQAQSNSSRAHVASSLGHHLLLSELTAHHTSCLLRLDISLMGLRRRSTVA
eukprot:GDKH01006259.1.p3 GENE.GDKH01006259.1~~GDKH01006259.1.p3  ORF type:complete len:51 (-),score=4.68 GDKH01006259.1:114-266(-)